MGLGVPMVGGDVGGETEGREFHRVEQEVPRRPWREGREGRMRWGGAGIRRKSGGGGQVGGLLGWGRAVCLVVVDGMRGIGIVKPGHIPQQPRSANPR